MESVSCTDSDKYESDNLILQLEITLNKLAAICKKNGKLVDYVGKKVRCTVTNCWNAEKDNFAKLSWAEMDDSDLDLDLDLETNQLQIEGECDTNTALAASFLASISEKSATKQTETGIKLQVIEGKKGKRQKQMQRMSKLMFVQQKLLRRRQKLEETEKFEIEQLERKKAEQELRMKRAEERVEKQHKMMKEKSIALTWKLAEIAHSNEIITENLKNAIIERQIKAKKQKEKIKNNKLFKKQQQQMIRCNNNKNKLIYNRRHEQQQDAYDHLEKETIYFNETELKRLCGKFLYIPRIVRKSLASDLYENIENLYRDTSPLLSSTMTTNKSALSLTDILRKWIKNINSNQIHFGHSKYNKDVLLIINRFICFDLNELDTECAQLMVKNFLILTKNKVGAELLCAKYSQKLLLFAVDHVHEYNAINLLCKIFQNESTQINHSGSDQEYKRFKKQTLSLLFFNLFKSSFLTKISSIFSESNANIQNVQDKKVIDSILNLLCEIAAILTNFNSFLNDEISQLIRAQLFALKIMPFIYSLTTGKHLINVHQIKLASKCLLFLKHLTQCNKSAVTELILCNKERFCHILSFLFEFICNNFDSHHSNIKNNHIMDIAHNLFDFISVSFIANRAIQDIIDKKLIHNLCNNVPFYFILQKNGQNVLFPALISISFNHQINLNLIHSSSLNTKHLKKYIRRNVYSDVKLLHCASSRKTMKLKTNSAFAAKIPAKYWSDCLRFYCPSL